MIPILMRFLFAEIKVKEIPSSAMEPFATTNFANLGGRLSSQKTVRPVLVSLVILAVPSMCPLTMCPSKRASAFSGSSRLMRSPG